MSRGVVRLESHILLQRFHRLIGDTLDNPSKNGYRHAQKPIMILLNKRLVCFQSVIGGSLVRKLIVVFLFCFATVAFAATVKQIYGYKLKTIDGDPTSLAKYKGKVLLLVNVASACGFTPQYAALESVYEKYKDQGLVIVGIPANNFANQESGTDAEIKTFCNRKYHVTFPMMSKVSVLGADKTPLYQYLTDNTKNPAVGGEIKWNFTKFLIARDGMPIIRFEPATKPDSPEVIAAIEGALKKS
jgi:glutathione peroxidase